MDKQLIFKLAVFLPVLLVGIIDYLTVFKNNFFLEEWENLPNEKEKKKYYIRLILYIVISLIVSLIIHLIKEKTINNSFIAGQLGSVLLMFMISIDTDIKYHVVNRHTLRMAYIIPFVFSIMRVSTLFEGITLLGISLLIFVLFIFATNIGSSDFRAMVIAFMTAYPLKGPIVGLLILILGMSLSIMYYIYYKKKHKLTKKEMEKSGAPIAPAILVAPLIFLVGHLLLVA